MKKFWFHAGVGLISAMLGACSFSESSKSSSASSESLADILSSSSGSSSKSAQTPRESYETDVRDYTKEFVKSSSGDLETFRVHMAKLAEKNGIANWAEDKSTYVSIGKGLKKAGLSQPQYEAFKSSLAGSDTQKMQYIQDGYGK